MLFIIQTVKGKIRDIEEIQLLKELDRTKYTLSHTYVLSESSTDDSIEGIDKGIPVGSIEFVEAHLLKYHGINKMTPIEVPDTLRTDEYLGRSYKIVDRDNLPDNGYWFVKKIDRLKEMCTLGVVGNYKDKLDKGKYVYSGFIEDIVSEYRIMVLNGTIQGIQWYGGDCTVFPSVNILRSMITDYESSGKQPKAYTLDVMVVGNENKNKTHIIEVHPFACVGTYGFNSEYLPLMYKLGYEYYLNREK